MTQAEKVRNFIHTHEATEIFTGFWHHFPKSVIELGVDSQIKAHMDFAKKTNVDILKIMNENEMRSSNKIINLSDWKNLPKLNSNSKLVSNQKEILERIVFENKGDRYLLATIHGLLASLSHSSGYSYSVSPEIIREHYSRDKSVIKDAIKQIHENTQYMVDIALSSGVDGIYYAALGGESDKLTDDEFYDILYEPEISLLEQVKGNKDIFLHMCKEKVNLNRYKDYPTDVVNWAMHESEYTLEEAKKIFNDKIILGGFDDRSGVLVDGTTNEIIKVLNKIVSNFNDTPFIIGADCTLPTEFDLEKINVIKTELSKEKNK